MDRWVIHSGFCQEPIQNNWRKKNTRNLVNCPTRKFNRYKSGKKQSLNEWQRIEDSFHVIQSKCIIFNVHVFLHASSWLMKEPQWNRKWKGTGWKKNKMDGAKRFRKYLHQTSWRSIHEGKFLCSSRRCWWSMTSAEQFQLGKRKSRFHFLLASINWGKAKKKKSISRFVHGKCVKFAEKLL